MGTRCERATRLAQTRDIERQGTQLQQDEGEAVADVHSIEQRRTNMSAIRSRDSQAEMSLRHALRLRGLSGYRCAWRGVYGRPDVAFTRWKVAVFVDGCFWHGCPTCYVRPQQNRAFWDAKLSTNQARDRVVDEELGRQGWVVLRFWEHDVLTETETVVQAISVALLAAGREAG